VKEERIWQFPIALAAGASHYLLRAFVATILIGVRLQQHIRHLDMTVGHCPAHGQMAFLAPSHQVDIMLQERLNNPHHACCGSYCEERGLRGAMLHVQI
jgi:hypothetical protein